MLIKSQMACPKCRTETLRFTGETSDAMSCTKCHGIWIHSERFARFSEEAMDRSGDEWPVDESEGPDKDSDLKAGLCPHGHGLLIRAKPDMEPAFYLDRCMTCNGIWFDRDELNRVAAAGMIDGLFEIWTRAWQRNKRKERFQREYMETLERNLGRDILNGLDVLVEKLRDHPFRNQAVEYFQEEMEKRKRKRSEQGGDREK